MSSWQDDLFDNIEKLSEEQAKFLLNEIAVTLARPTQSKAEHHDKIAKILKEAIM